MRLYRVEMSRSRFPFFVLANDASVAMEEVSKAWRAWGYNEKVAPVSATLVAAEGQYQPDGVAWLITPNKDTHHD